MEQTVNVSSTETGAAQISAQLCTVNAQIESAAQQAGREPADITLVAVSKTQPAGQIEPALKSGHVHFGENRVQEAEGKWPALKEAYPHCKLHLIGPLQSNKALKAVQLFDVIETVDRPSLAKKLGAIQAKQGALPKLLVQVNTGEEPQKAGIAPTDLDAFIAYCREDCGLDICGLMCIPPADEEPAFHFALLKKLAEKHELGWLSMGMSADYETAIAFGATSVRVGTAIFGARR